MQQKETKKIEVLLPPAVGYSINILINFLFRNTISPRYYPRMLALGVINLINLPFRTYERLFINPRFKKTSINKDPVFIIGHWRSGTTHLHNLLSQDPKMGYLTTFQGVFPDTLFNKAGNFIFKNFTNILIPRTRKGDNVRLNPDYPQEEEFALGDKVPLSYYYFWMFPKNTLIYYEKALRFQTVSPKKKEKWKRHYITLIKKSIRNINQSDRFLSKNPPNTSRIPVLLEMFPNAKFIFLHRNPVEVFLSTCHFFNKMMPHLQLHNVSHSRREFLIFYVYKKMMHQYLSDRELVPSENLVEIAFKELENDPLTTTKNIYEQLSLEGYDKARPLFEQYINRSSSYKKNRHSISKALLDKVIHEWGFAMKQWDYTIPDNIEILAK